MKFKKILTPVDFSENSVSALRYAAAFAQASGAGIIILHIADPDALDNDLKGNLSPEHLLEILLKSDFLTGIKTTILVAKGGIPGTILEESRKNKVDLIVMGTQGSGNMIRNLIGTNTSHVVALAQCPVLVVPNGAIYQSVRKVVLAIDLEHRTDTIIEDMVNLVKFQKAAVLLAYVSMDSDGQSERELNELTNSLRHKTGYDRIVCKVIHSSEFPMGLESYAKSIEADVVVMITHHRGVFESVFDPSQTKIYSYHTSIPLLVVPHHKTPVFFF